MKVVISPFSRPLRNHKRNPKNYPHFKELISLLKQLGHDIIQIGRLGEEKLTDDFRTNLSLEDIKKLLIESDLWISVDNFLPHLANHINKRGIVIFSKSDPMIFGYEQNINLLKNKKYLKEKQFDVWEACQYDEDAFLPPEEINRHVQEVLK
jgi:ADP-heptose:LPS heptosyltransferase